jgi:hypothetical protein
VKVSVHLCKQRSLIILRLYDTMLNFVENLLENERGPMNDQDLTKTDYDPDRSLVLIEGLSHFLTNFLQNLASCQTSFRRRRKWYLAAVHHPMWQKLQIYEKAYGPRAEKCYFTPYNSVLKFNFTPTRAKK